MDFQADIRSKILMKIFKIALAAPNVEETKKILTEELITKIDHTAFGFYCEFPEEFERIIKGAYIINSKLLMDWKIFR